VPASDWQNRAACRDADPDLFAYDPSADPRTKAEAAKAICAGCPVTDDCLSFALATFSRRDDRTGIYGGLTPSERAQRERPARRRGLASDPEWASKTFAKAAEIGVQAAAQFFNADRTTLERAWKRHGLGSPVVRRPSPVQTDPELAASAFEFARQARSIRAAALAFGVERKTLRRAWERHGLGHPLEGLSAEEIQAERNRRHPWQRDERVRRAKAEAERRERRAPVAFPAGRTQQMPGAASPTERSRVRLGRDEERER
jgi:WhiB family redox-sensing transcriptional regulator